MILTKADSGIATLADLAGKTSPGPDEMSQGIMLRARMS